MWREFKLFGLRLLSLSLSLPQSCAMYHHHLRWAGSTCFIPWPGLAGIRGIWGLSGLWQDWGLLWPSNVWVSFDNLRCYRPLECRSAGVRWWWWGWWAIITKTDRAANNHLTRRGRPAALIWSQITGDYDQLMSVRARLLIAIYSNKTSD